MKRKPKLVTEKRWVWVSRYGVEYLFRRGERKSVIVHLTRHHTRGEELVRVTLSYPPPKEAKP